MARPGAAVVDAAVALMCLSAAIIYSGILGDTSTQLLTLAGVPAFANRRTTNILGLTLGALLPLSLLNDLSALAFTSLLARLHLATRLPRSRHELTLRSRRPLHGPHRLHRRPWRHRLHPPPQLTKPERSPCTAFISLSVSSLMLGSTDSKALICIIRLITSSAL